jgi:hypothetical protein
VAADPLCGLLHAEREMLLATLRGAALGSERLSVRSALDDEVQGVECSTGCGDETAGLMESCSMVRAV